MTIKGIAGESLEERTRKAEAVIIHLRKRGARLGKPFERDELYDRR